MNLSLLGYFKYSMLFVENVLLAGDTAFPFVTIFLPLGISFLTFQHIAHLVNVSRMQVTTFRFLEYCVFCSFFPKLFAGPITRYGEFAPRYSDLSIFASRRTFFGSPSQPWPSC